MLNIKEKPYGLLILMAIVLLITLILPSITHSDFQEITTFRLPLPVLAWIMPLFLSSEWLIYLLTRRILYSMTVT